MIIGTSVVPILIVSKIAIPFITVKLFSKSALHTLMVWEFGPIVKIPLLVAVASSQFEKIPGYELPEDHVKIPAAWLIDQCGWKGYTKSGIGVHKNQALVLVNHGGGLGSDIKNLAEEIKKSVAEKFGIILDPEVNII